MKLWNLSKLAIGVVTITSVIWPATTYAVTGSSNKSSSPGKYIDYSKAGQKVGTFTTLAAAEKLLDEYPGGTIEDSTGRVVYREPDFTTVDLRFPAPSNVNAASINRFLAEHGSPLNGLGSSFMYAQKEYGVNAAYLVAHAIEESKWGRSSLALTRDNLYGTGAFDANPDLAGSFPSLDYAIRYQAWVVRKNYLNPGFSHYVSPTLEGMNRNYASDLHWADNIRAVMNQLALFLDDNVKSYRQYKPGTPDPSPIVNAEPAYNLSGAIAVALPDAYYKGAPVYSSVGEGQLRMFSRILQLGDYGDDVSTLQTTLNDLDDAGLTVNGQFDTATQTALEKYQTEQGLDPTGTCDFNLWTNYLDVPAPKRVNAGSRVTIDKIMQGMVGGDVVEWYHIRGNGWVNARDVRLTNVYRITVKNPTSPSTSSVPVYDVHNASRKIAILHAGDEVVCSNPVGLHGEIVIHFANGPLTVGILKTADAHLTAVH